MVDSVEQFQFQVSLHVLNFNVRSITLDNKAMQWRRLREFCAKCCDLAALCLREKKTQQNQNQQWWSKSEKVSETDKDLKEHGSCFKSPNFLCESS